MGTEQQTDWLEGRRMRAYELAQAGWTQKAIAGALGVSEGAVSKWLKRAGDGGPEALRRHPARGADSKLNAEQLARLPEILARGAEASGFAGAVWTRARVRQVIEDEFGVNYHVDPMSYLLKKIGWSRQKPKGQASQRDDTKIERWQQDWPAVEKKPSSRSKP